MTTRAIIAFNHYRDADLSPVARTIHTEMSSHAAVFSDPPVSMEALLALCTDYDEKLAARASRGRADTQAFTVARTALATTLRMLGHYVNGTACGNAVIVSQSGFPSYVRRYSANYTPPSAPGNMRLDHGPVSGTALLRYKPGRSRSMSEVAANTVDPTDEAEWKPRGTYSGGRVKLDGFTPGELVWVRARTVGLKGVVGDWSATVQLRVV